MHGNSGERRISHISSRELTAEKKNKGSHWNGLPFLPISLFTRVVHVRKSFQIKMPFNFPDYRNGNRNAVRFVVFNSSFPFDPSNENKKGRRKVCRLILMQLYCYRCLWSAYFVSLMKYSTWNFQLRVFASPVLGWDGKGAEKAWQK